MKKSLPVFLYEYDEKRDFSWYITRYRSGTKSLERNSYFSHYSGNEEWRINDLLFPFNKKKRLLVLHYMESRKARKV